MKIGRFRTLFELSFPFWSRNRPAAVSAKDDICPDVEGMSSARKGKLLNLAFSCLAPDECYCEIGTYLGKSLISAMLGNPERPVAACDNFSQFTETNSFDKLMTNLRKYKLDSKIQFLNGDFRTIISSRTIQNRVGLYFYDGAHDENSQYLGIRNIEPLLSDKALVIVDDWRFAPDSQSYARAGTERAIAESSHRWHKLYELPARYNGDLEMWWNGVGVYSFKR
jgi:predicted O-methyltransferase YrrM